MSTLDTMISELRAHVAEFENEIGRCRTAHRRAHWTRRLDHSKAVLARATRANRGINS